MPKQIELDVTYLKMAEEWGQLSKARRRKVGCLIVKDGQIISDGYNGTPAGYDNNCEYETLLEFDEGGLNENQGRTELTIKLENSDENGGRASNG